MEVRCGKQRPGCQLQLDSTQVVQAEVAPDAPSPSPRKHPLLPTCRMVFAVELMASWMASSVGFMLTFGICARLVRMSQNNTDG